MENLYHDSFSTDDNSSSSNGFFWAGEGLNDVRKVQFSGVEDHKECGEIDSFYSNFEFFPDDPSEEQGYLLSTNHQKYNQIYDDYGLSDDNLQFDIVSPPLQFDEQYPTMVPLCDPTKDMPNSNSATPLASFEILKSYGKGLKRLWNEGNNNNMQPIDDQAAATDEVIVGRKLSTEDLMRIAGTRFIQSSSSSSSTSEFLPFLENHPFGFSFSGLSDEEKEDVELAVRKNSMIILDKFKESCSYTFRTKYFDPILAWVHEILVGIIL